MTAPDVAEDGDDDGASRVDFGAMSAVTFSFQPEPLRPLPGLKRAVALVRWSSFDARTPLVRCDLLEGERLSRAGAIG